MSGSDRVEQYGYITFRSVSYAMRFEAALKDCDARIKIIPVPRSISSSCGFCARFELSDIDFVKKAMADKKLEYVEMYEGLPA